MHTIKLGTIQRRLAWSLDKDDKSDQEKTLALLEIMFLLIISMAILTMTFSALSSGKEEVFEEQRNGCSCLMQIMTFFFK